MSLFAAALEGVALTATAVAVGATGLPRPLMPFAVLAVLTAVCANRDALFPSEYAVTAEAAVIVCAVVIFEQPSYFAAPLLLGVASGWLDSYHWESRSFVRMTFNSGKAGVAALSAVVTFTTVHQATGHASGTALAIAIVAAAGVYTIVDSLLMVVLMRALSGRPMREIIRLTGPLDAMTFPLACYGAAAGVIALDASVFLAALVLAPLAFMPELMVAPIMRRSRAMRRAAVAGVGAAVALTTLYEVAGAHAALVALALVALGTLVAVQLVPATRNGPAFAVGAVLLVGALVDEVGATATAAFVVAAAAMWVVDGAPRHRRARAGLLAWLALVFVVAIPMEELGPAGVARVLVAGVTVAVAASAVSWWGRPPWQPGHVLDGSLRARPRRRLALAVVVVVTIACAIAAVTPGFGDARHTVVTIATVGADLAAIMVLSGVRQWRFSPVRRRIELAVLSLGAVGVALAYPAPALAGAPWTALAVGALVALAALIGLPVAKLADASSGPSASANLLTDTTSRRSSFPTRSS